MLGYLVRSKIAASALLGVLVTLLKSSTVVGEYTKPICTIGSGGAAPDSPCKINVYYGQEFQYNCGATPASNPDITATGNFKLCKTKITDHATACSGTDILDLSTAITHTKTNDVFTAVIGTSRVTDHKDTTILYASCKPASGTQKLYMEITIHPFAVIPDAFTNICEVKAEPSVLGECELAAFKGEKVHFTGPTTLSTKIPTDFGDKTGNICKVEPGSNCTGNDEDWPTFLGASPSDFTAPAAGMYGAIFNNVAAFSAVSKTAYVLMQNATNTLRGALTFFTVDRPGSLKEVKIECNAPPCTYPMGVGDKVLINCTGATTTTPDNLAEVGTFCAEDIGTGAVCPNSKTIVPSANGGSVILDTVYKQYVVLSYDTKQETDKVFYAKCNGGAYEYTAKLTFDKSGTTSTTGTPTTTTSSASSVVVSVSLLFVTSVLAFVGA